LKRFEEKYLLLSGFTLEVVQLIYYIAYLNIWSFRWTQRMKVFAGRMINSNTLTHRTRITAVSEWADRRALSRIAVQHADDGYSRDEEISAVGLNLFVRRQRFKRWECERIGSVLEAESCKIAFL